MIVDVMHWFFNQFVYGYSTSIVLNLGRNFSNDNFQGLYFSRSTRRLLFAQLNNFHQQILVDFQLAVVELEPSQMRRLFQECQQRIRSETMFN